MFAGRIDEEVASVDSEDIDAAQTEEDRADLAFRALAHRDRRRLLCLIGPDEHRVGALADAAGLDQPITSQHLKVLRSAGLVRVRVDGNRRQYSLDFTRVAQLQSFLDQFWTERLGLVQVSAASHDRNVTGGA